MTNSQDQKNAEKIAEFLGIIYEGGILERFWFPVGMKVKGRQLFGHGEFKIWLASDAGTVAMLIKLPWHLLIKALYETWQKRRQPTPLEVNTALQSAILELMEVK